MNNKQMKKATVDAINVMISRADKGPSGFWVEDHESCGNPAVFPEFEEGLKRGRLVQKEHYFFPWNTAIMYGDRHGNINTGCYHSCSISKARYLTTEELKEVLARFKTRMENGDYDCVDHLSPLLTKAESRHIEDRILAEQYECERCERQKRQERLKKAAALIAKYPDEASFLAINYGEDTCVDEKDGLVFFNPDSRKDVVGAEKMSYDEYLDVQLASLGHAYRSGFANGIFNYLLEFKGQIEKVKPKHICFKRIFISGMYTDGTMFDDSGTLILLIVLIVSAFLLIVLKLAQFVNHFSREQQYLLTEMHRAADYNEYRYWRRELRCLYLCLIPFVTERNVMKVYPVFFHRAKHATEEKRSDGLMHILAPSMLAICICAICLCGVSWAWFTASTSTGTTAIQSSSYKLLYQVGEDATATELAEAGTAYTLTSDTTVITLKAAGTAGATGYCSITVGSETYYTEQISVNGTSEFTFTVNAAAGTNIILTPKWGTYSHTATIQDNGEIAATGSQQSNTQTPDNTVTTEPSTEPTVPTTPTAPTTPSSTPKESTTTTPEPSATAPAATQPEPTDTEPTPAPETTTPENTTAAQTEPPTTEESENN